MRSFLIVGLVVLAGCATSSRPRDIEWDSVRVHPSATSEPSLSEGRLVLSGRAIRTKNIYAAPITMECELQAGPATATNSFYFDFVPAAAPIVDLAAHYLAVKIDANQGKLEIWESNLEQPVRLIQSASAPAGPDGRYKVAIDVQASNLVVRVNGQAINAGQGLPYDKFSMELRTFPPPSAWQVGNLTIR